MGYGYNALCACVCWHTLDTHTHTHNDNNVLWYSGMSWTAGQLVCFSCNTDSISESTYNNLLLFCPLQSKVSRLKDREQQQDQFCAGWHAVVGTRRSSTHCFLSG